MRILMIAPEFPPNFRGGLGKQVGELVEALSVNHDVGVVSPNLTETSPGALHFNATTYADALPASGIDSLSQLNVAMSSAIDAALQEGRWDIVHAHDWVIAPTVTNVLGHRDIPILTTFHADNSGLLGGSESDRARRLNWEASIVRVSTAISGVSMWLADDLRARYPDARVRHIPNGMNIPGSMLGRSVHSDPFRAIFVGRLVPYKGVEDVLRAWKIVLESLPDAQLDVVGDGFQKDELVQISLSLGISASVNFLGWLQEDDIQRYLANSSLAVFPSREEAFGLAAAEALAAGVPTLLSDIPAYRELVPAGFEGFFAPGNSQDIAEKITCYRPKPHELQSLAEGIANRYSWHRVVSLYERCYKDLVSEFLPPDNRVD